MAILYVTYPGQAGTRFDRAYYVDVHLPLVRNAWNRHGLEGAAAFFPPGGDPDGGDGTIAVCICRFRDEAALRAALASPHSGPVMADVPRFTDATPSQQRTVPV